MRDLEKAIREAATHKIRAHERRRMQSRVETERRQRRSTKELPKLTVKRPEYWDYDASHDPYHVRSRVSAISHAIDRAIKSGTYIPFAPTGFAIPKPSGSDRTVSIFAIADEVVSKRLYGALMAKNRSRLSARSYAYRNDLGVHDAIAHIQSEWANEHRLFVAQYDFSDYFGSIDHGHVWSTIDSLRFAITRTERRLLRQFMQSPLPTLLPASLPSERPPARERGVPQGTTISLLAANIAATPLDREFERLGVSFVRYADDIVIWSRDYSSLGRAVDELHRFAERAKCPISSSKSLGVGLLAQPTSAIGEIRTFSGATFLSHHIELRVISLADRSVELAKRTMLEFIYNHLLREPLRGAQKLERLRGGLDRDYLALLWELRRYLYGSLSERQLRRLLKGPLPPMISLGGLLGRHPMVNDLAQLQGSMVGFQPKSGWRSASERRSCRALLRWFRSRGGSRRLLYGRI